MTGFRPDISRFPKRLEQGDTKREIAARASEPQGFKLIQTAAEIYPGRMANIAALYFIAPKGHEVCKIGIANDPWARLKGVQTGCWAELSIKALFWYPHIDHAQAHEYAALSFAKKHKLRLKGEWVDLPWDEAVGLALTAVEPDTKFTDCHGLAHDWFAEYARQKEEYEERIYALRPKAA